jgi:hypothetical protein
VVSAGATDKVYLQGLDFEGLNTSLSAVQVNSGLAVYIIQCTIRDFAQNGVNVVSSTANTRVVIQDSVIENNGTTGSNPANGGVNVQGNGVNNAASIFNTLVDGNKNFAVQVAAGNSIALVRSVLSGSPAGIAGAGTVVSFGPSNIITGTGAVTTTTNYK